jgi:hypothetical protein
MMNLVFLLMLHSSGPTRLAPPPPPARNSSFPSGINTIGVSGGARLTAGGNGRPSLANLMKPPANPPPPPPTRSAPLPPSKPPPPPPHRTGPPIVPPPAPPLPGSIGASGTLRKPASMVSSRTVEACNFAPRGTFHFFFQEGLLTSNVS